jgi:prevent-host-death family protein
MATQDLNIVGASEAGARFPELLELVGGGEEVTITKDGLPVAKLVPLRRASTSEERAEVIRRWKEARKDILPLGMNVKDLVSEGRP